jgi:hypothetical protein
MKFIPMAAGVSASLLAGSAYAGAVIAPLGTSLGARLGSALPLTGLGLVGIATVVLIAGVRILRRKQDK